MTRDVAVVSAEKTSTPEQPGGSELAIDRSSAGSDALTWIGSLPRTMKGAP
jgi:hypothetical protein